MKMPPSDQVLKSCAISREELASRIEVLLTQFRPALEDWVQGEQQSVLGINRICEYSALAEMLVSVPGFQAVKKSIINAKDSPHGDWFHLEVAYLLHQIGEEILLEQKVNGAPKDIFLRGDQVIVECKSFTTGEAFTQTVKRCLNEGIDPSVHPEAPPGFTRKVGFLGFMPGRPEYFTIEVNEFRRFLANGLQEKSKQAVPGRCNIIAITSREFANDPRKLRGDIASTLDSDEFNEVAAVLLVQVLPFATEDCTKRGMSFLTHLVENPRYLTGSRNTRVPEDLAARIVGRFFIGSPPPK
jgi:hypothetical protein